jgi:hypothetical protein
MSPAASGPRLSLADQSLANLVGFLATQRIEDSRTNMALEALVELLPHVNRSITPMQALSEAAGEALNAAAKRNQKGGSVAWCQAMLTASSAMQEFLFWRASMAIDAWRASHSHPNEETAA